MASTFRLELVTPERLLASGDVQEVVAPGFEGEFGVLPEHTHYLVVLEIGVMRIRKGDGQVVRVAIGGGFAEVTPGRMVVMADTAERAEEIDVERARQAKERAEERLKAVSLDDDTYLKAYASLQRALARLSASG
jgi:F-type H+-transporting ATPase subunit epsilon